jgi:uncharacterized phage protein (TIGR01671 family)
MREIKFRAWDKKLKEWMDIEFYHLVSFNGDVYFYSMGKLTKYPEAELMQYTGLKDKNGKEIYEGDIIEEITKNGEGDKIRSVVTFYDGIFGDDTHDEWTVKELIDDFGAYVIGNIYENPDLIKTL